MTLSKDELTTLSHLLDEALEVPEEKREAWIEGLATSTSRIKTMLRSLLSDGLGAESAYFLNTLPKFTVVDDDAARAPPEAGVVEGAIVGAYRLIREIGRGGMSTVWLATRTDEQIKRAVALKLPHLHLDRHQFVERFARERDILAALSHPNIAHLYDAGVTEAGQPFLALEYVDGISITEYCDRQQATIRVRIDLFLQVLGAVQYAHSHLVIHRDLKPSNILATKEGHVTLLDFGIAKLITDGIASATQLTLLSGRVLTPDYAAPEQIAGEALSTSSDVYSLGVVLYELLTGARPYRLKRDSRGALEEAILSADPLRPSQASISSSISQSRATTIKKMRSTLNGDLDTIILKALRKRPGERYATVDAFRQDIERYLSGHAVQAKADTLWYRSKKFLARNRIAAGAAATVFTALITGTGLALWQAGVARQQARISQENARTSEAVQRFMENLFEANSADQPNPELARQTTARELLDRGRSKIETALKDSPAAKLRVLDTLSRMYRDLGYLNTAADLARARVAIVRSLYDEWDVRVAQALVDFGDFADAADLSDEARTALAAAEHILDHARDTTSSTRAQLDGEMAYHYFAMTGDYARALSYAEQGIQLYRRRGPSSDLAFALDIKSAASDHLGYPGIAKAAAQEALAVNTATNGAVRSLLPEAYLDLGYAQTELAEFAGAEYDFHQAVANSGTETGVDPMDTLEGVRGLGGFFLRTSRIEQALAALAPARELALKIAARGESSTIPALILQTNAQALIGYGRIEQGLEEFRPVLQMVSKIPSLYARAQADFGVALIEAGQYAEADKSLTDAAAIELRLGWDKTLDYNNNVNLRTQLLLAEGRSDEAAKTFEAFRIRADSDSPPLFLRQLEQTVRRAEILMAQGQAVKAIAQAAEVRRHSLTDENRPYLGIYEARALLVEGKARLLTQQAQEALPLLQQAVAMDKQLYDAKRSPVLADAEIALANCYLDLGNHKQAQVMLTDAKAIHATHGRLGEHYKGPLRQLEARMGPVRRH